MLAPATPLTPHTHVLHTPQTPLTVSSALTESTVDNRDNHGYDEKTINYANIVDIVNNGNDQYVLYNGTITSTNNGNRNNGSGNYGNGNVTESAGQGGQGAQVDCEELGSNRFQNSKPNRAFFRAVGLLGRKRERREGERRSGESRWSVKLPSFNRWLGGKGRGRGGGVGGVAERVGSGDSDEKEDEDNEDDEEDEYGDDGVYGGGENERDEEGDDIMVSTSHPLTDTYDETVTDNIPPRTPQSSYDDRIDGVSVCFTAGSRHSGDSDEKKTRNRREKGGEGEKSVEEVKGNKREKRGVGEKGGESEKAEKREKRERGGESEKREEGGGGGSRLSYKRVMSFVSLKIMGRRGEGEIKKIGSRDGENGRETGGTGAKEGDEEREGREDIDEVCYDVIPPSSPTHTFDSPPTSPYLAREEKRADDSNNRVGNSSVQFENTKAEIDDIERDGNKAAKDGDEVTDERGEERGHREVENEVENEVGREVEKETGREVGGKRKPLRRVFSLSYLKDRPGKVTRAWGSILKRGASLRWGERGEGKEEEEGKESFLVAREREAVSTYIRDHQVEEERHSTEKEDKEEEEEDRDESEKEGHDESEKEGHEKGSEEERVTEQGTTVDRVTVIGGDDEQAYNDNMLACDAIMLNDNILACNENNDIMLAYNEIMLVSEEEMLAYQEWKEAYERGEGAHVRSCNCFPPYLLPLTVIHFSPFFKFISLI